MTDNEQRQRPTVAHFSTSVSVVDDDSSSESPSPDEENEQNSGVLNNGTNSETKTTTSSGRYVSVPTPLKKLWADQVGWVPSKLNARALKPVIRSAVSAWVRTSFLAYTAIQNHC